MGFYPILTKAFPKGSLIKQARMRLSAHDMWKGAMGAPIAELGPVLRTVRPDLLMVDFVLRDLSLLARPAGISCALLSTSLDDFRLRLIYSRTDPADELPVLTACPKELDLPDSVKPSRHYIEASIDLERREPGDFPWERLDPDRPLIFCTLGSHCEDYKESVPFFRAVIDAMRQKPDWQLLLAMGNPHVDPGEFQPVPPNVLLVSWAPQLAILQKASIMMTHGGLGTIKESIFFGVPMIVFPVAWDQPKNAERVVHHGLGVQGSITDISARQVVHLIDQIAGDPSFKARAQSMSRIFQEIESRGAGAELIEKLVAAAQKNRQV
jgi:UDP:flavonoid glycosyltransferase YjiC (YdhE family)